MSKGWRDPRLRFVQEVGRVGDPPRIEVDLEVGGPHLGEHHGSDCAGSLLEPRVRDADRLRGLSPEPVIALQPLQRVGPLGPGPRQPDRALETGARLVEVARVEIERREGAHESRRQRFDEYRLLQVRAGFVVFPAPPLQARQAGVAGLVARESLHVFGERLECLPVVAQLFLRRRDLLENAAVPGVEALKLGQRRQLRLRVARDPVDDQLVPERLRVLRMEFGPHVDHRGRPGDVLRHESSTRP